MFKKCDNCKKHKFITSIHIVELLNHNCDKLRLCHECLEKIKEDSDLAKKIEKRLDK